MKSNKHFRECATKMTMKNILFSRRFDFFNTTTKTGSLRGQSSLSNFFWSVCTHARCCKYRTSGDKHFYYGYQQNFLFQSRQLASFWRPWLTTTTSLWSYQKERIFYNFIMQSQLSSKREKRVKCIKIKIKYNNHW